MPGSKAQVYITGVPQGSVHWPETYFESRAMAEPGTCQITLRGDGGGIGDVVRLFVNGQNVWTGYILSKTKTTWFPDKDDPKTILQGVDLNILLDRLIVYNKKDLTLHPTGGEKFKGKAPTGKQGDKGEPIGTVPPETTVDAYLRAMIQDTDLDSVEPKITLDCNISDMWNQTDAPGLCHNAGTTLRALVADSVAQAAATQQGSIIFYITPEGKLIVNSYDNEGGGETSDVRMVSNTIDASNVRTEAFVFAGKLDPTPGSPQVYLNVGRKGGKKGTLLLQYTETVSDHWSQEYVDARADKIIAQQGENARTARWQQLGGSLKPGQMVTPPNGDTVPVRSIRYSFPNFDMVQMDVEAGYDTLDPWGLILAAQRPPSRGMTTPSVVVLPPRDPNSTTDEPPPACDPFTKVEEVPGIKGKTENANNSADCLVTYGYIKGSMEVFAAKGSTANLTASGLSKLNRWSGVPLDPQYAIGGAPAQTDPNVPTSQSIGYIETDPEKAKVQIILPPGYFAMKQVVKDGGIQWEFGLKEGVILICQYHVANIPKKEDG